MASPVTISFSPSMRPVSASVSSSGTVTVRLFPGWVVRFHPWWRS